MTHELPPIVMQLGWTLVHSVWQGALIAGLYALASLWLRARGPEPRYAASLVALALLGASPVATFMLLDAPTLPDAAALAIAPAVAVAAPPATLAAPTLLERLELSIEPWLPALVVLWMLGVAFASSRLWSSWRNLVALRRSAVLLEGGELRAMVVLLRSRLGVEQVVRVARSQLVESPTVIGWLQPMILLPASALTGLSPTQLAMILAHELAHIRRHDYLVNVAQTVLETLLFFHPAVRWISERARHEREECCDRLAVEVCGDPLGYARALAELEELRGLQLAWSLGAVGGALLERIERLLGQQPREQKGTVWFASSLGLAILTGVVTTAGAPYLAGPDLGAGPAISASMDSGLPRPAARAAPAPAPVTAPQPQADEAEWVVPRARPRDGLEYQHLFEFQMPDFDTPTPDVPAATAPTAVVPGGAGPEVYAAALVRQPQLSGGAIIEPGRPYYPHRALRRNVEGFVIVEFTVGTDGLPRDLEVTAAEPYDMFETAALKAVQRTRFEPFRVDGARVERRVKQYIAFNIAKGGEACEPVTGTRLCNAADRLGPRSRGVEVYVIR